MNDNVIKLNWGFSEAKNTSSREGAGFICSIISPFLRVSFVYITSCQQIVEMLSDTAALTAKMAKLQQELIDRTERRENYDDVTEEILRLRELLPQTAMDDNAKTEYKQRIRELLKFIERQKSKVCVFDGSLVKKLLEKVTIYDDYLEFWFKSGVTVSVEK